MLTLSSTASMPKFFLAAVGALVASFFSSLVLAQRSDCDPCIDRADYNVKAIMEGASDESFWQEMQAIMVQASKDMGVDFAMDLYETFDSETMAADIWAAADESTPSDALIVTIPNQEVQDAVVDIKDILPVFGFNAILDEDVTWSIHGFVGSNEALSGKDVGKRIKKLLEAEAADGGEEEKSTGLFIDYAPGLDVFDTRY